MIGNRPIPQGGTGIAGVRKYDSRGNELWTRQFAAVTPDGTRDSSARQLMSPESTLLDPPAANTGVVFPLTIITNWQAGLKNESNRAYS